LSISAKCHQNWSL